jgi:hypothetical protein
MSSLSHTDVAALLWRNHSAIISGGESLPTMHRYQLQRELDNGGLRTLYVHIMFRVRGLNKL